MTAEKLRAAAALMRERAEAATPGPWRVIGGGEYVTPIGISVAPDDGGVNGADAAHIAAADPPFMLAVAEMLENAAEDLELQEPGGGLAKRWDMRIHIAGDRALAVADAYLADDALMDAR